jgi:hypothetical protein
LEYKKVRSIVLREETPEFIKNKWILAGTWNSSLWKATNFFKSFESFMSWVASIPGSDSKDRMKQARVAWNGHVRRDKARLADVFNLTDEFCMV